MKCDVKGQFHGAIANFTRSVELDPKNASAYRNCGIAKTAKGLLDRAFADYRKAIEVAPPVWTYRADVERMLAQIGTCDSRHPKVKADLELYGKSAKHYIERKYAEAIEGLREIAGEFPKKQTGSDSAYNVACGYALLGEKKNAVDWLEKAAEIGYKDVAHIAKDTDLESLRAERHYRQLVEKLKTK